MTADLELDDAAEPRRPPRWHLLLPVGVVFLAAVLTEVLTPASEFRANQGDVWLYLQKAQALLAGQIPYRDFPFEYPPLALIPMVVPALVWPFGPLRVETYQWLFAAWVAMLMFVLGLVLGRIDRLGGGPQLEDRPRSLAVRLTIVSAGAGLALTWRFDLYPALLVMVALWAALEGRSGAAGVAVGLGVLAKLYPLALVPALAIPWLLPLDVRRLTRFVLAAAVTVELVMLPFILLAGGCAYEFLSYQADRGLQVESIGGGLAVLSGLIGGNSIDLSLGFGSVQVEGEFARVWLAALPIATAVGFGLLGVIGWFRIRADRAALGRVPARTVVMVAFAAVLVLLATSKVFSIQYVVWILPFAALLPRGKFWLAVAVVALTMPIHPLLYRELLDRQALPVLILNVRNGLLLALLGWVLWDLARSAARPVGGRPSLLNYGPRRRTLHADP